MGRGTLLLRSCKNVILQLYLVFMSLLKCEKLFLSKKASLMLEAIKYANLYLLNKNRFTSKQCNGFIRERVFH